MKWYKPALVAAGLAAYYCFTSPTSIELENKIDYPLPSEIKVEETSLEYKTVNNQKIVETKNVDFNKNFYIKTDRYKLIKDKDWLPSRIVGHTLSLPGKLIFWDWDYAWGQDKQRTIAALSMLENSKDIKDITLRLNHNEAFYDMYRMFTEPHLKERNNILARSTLGTITSLGNEIWAEFSRGSYYNPLTSTAVCYSNIEGITAHELGHHKDFQRFSSDWEYMLSRVFPPAMLVQEWKASKNAKEFLQSFDLWQYDRYLLPAFGTYLLATYLASRKFLQQKAYYSNGGSKKFEKLREDEKPRINPLQTLRHYATLNLDLFAGMQAYQACIQNQKPELIGYAAFAGAMIGTHIITNAIMKNIIKYKHEKRGDFKQLVMNWNLF